MLESCLSLATSNTDKNGTERKEESKTGTSGKEKLAMFAYKENDRNICNTDTNKPFKEEKMEIDEKENEANGQEHKEEKEMEMNGKEEKLMEGNKKMETNVTKEEDGNMDIEESAPSSSQKKPVKGGRNVASSSTANEYCLT